MSSELESLNGRLPVEHQPMELNGEEKEVDVAGEEEVCMICSKPHLEGLHVGGEFICVDCEREIVQTDVQDAKYPFFIHRMKQLWQKKNA
jgi:hypothetical protein